MTKPIISEMAALRSRHFLLKADFIIPVLLLIVGTAIFRSSNLDLQIQSRYFSKLSGWSFYSSPIAMFIYRFGNIPALVLSIGALGLFIFSFSKTRLIPYRKIGIYLVLAMLVGPGILVNSILKDNWGRPRPRDLITFGGDYVYEAPLTIDPSSPGKSFPCGHATVGFYFFALAFVLRQRRPVLAGFVLGAALVWGSVIGWIRIGQGGHFASDVLWAGGLIYLCSYSLFRALGMHKNVYFTPSATFKHRTLKPLHKALLVIMGFAIVLGVMLATPYSAKQDYFISKELGYSKLQSLKLDFNTANLKISLANYSFMNLKINGFGFPGSKLKSNYGYTINGFDFTQMKRGFFTELACDASLIIDTLKVTSIHTTIHRGEVKLSLPITFIDTLYISPRTKLVSDEDIKIIILKSDKAAGKYWIDAPLLKLSYQP